MITGKVRDREAVIELQVSAPGAQALTVEAMIDTGYSGYLTLPGAFVTALQLTFAGYRRGTLADGSMTRMDVYLATVHWQGHEKEVLISQTSGIPLIGMSMLENCRISIDVVEAGDVMIEELS